MMLRALIRNAVLTLASLVSSAALMGLLVMSGLIGSVKTPGATPPDSAAQDAQATHVATQSVVPQARGIGR